MLVETVRRPTRCATRSAARPRGVGGAAGALVTPASRSTRSRRIRASTPSRARERGRARAALGVLGVECAQTEEHFAVGDVEGEVVSLDARTATLVLPEGCGRVRAGDGTRLRALLPRRTARRSARAGPRPRAGARRHALARPAAVPGRRGRDDRRPGRPGGRRAGARAPAQQQRLPGGAAAGGGCIRAARALSAPARGATRRRPRSAHREARCR